MIATIWFLNVKSVHDKCLQLLADRCCSKELKFEIQQTSDSQFKENEKKGFRKVFLKRMSKTFKNPKFDCENRVPKR